jgi:hypothetical protein
MTRFDEFGLPIPKQIPPMPKTKQSETKMNLRIRELINQAMESTGVEGLGGSYMELNPEKFAQLILQDIDKIVDELYHSMPLEQAAVLLTLDENIKEHFYGFEV